ncbi:MAG: TldD/PmbA family protein, partial [Oligoflexales bacterium]|nr:TldD/PmbA family protein [Oligoflexales bacterium]
VDEYKIKYFRSSTGIDYSYDFNQCGTALVYTAADNSGTFHDKVLLYASKVADLKVERDFIKAKIEESHLFINAAAVKAGKYPVVMDSEVVGVFAHESFGHKSEADFMIGDKGGEEAWGIGKKVGNKCLSIVDCGIEFASSGYCPFDDEGFPAQKTYLIKNGVLVGRLHSQQTAQFFEEAPTGNGRSINFEFEPIVRMTNTYVEAGESTVEELISKVKLGIFARDVNHGSGLSTFTIAPRKCYMIRNGKLAEPVRVSVISGSVFEALENVEACSKNIVIENSVFGGCGKMEQWPLSVAFGGPKVLVNDLMVS